MRSSAHTPSDAQPTTTTLTAPSQARAGHTGRRTLAGTVAWALLAVLAPLAAFAPVLAALAVELVVAAWYLGPQAVTLLARSLPTPARVRRATRVGASE